MKRNVSNAAIEPPGPGQPSGVGRRVKGVGCRLRVAGARRLLAVMVFMLSCERIIGSISSHGGGKGVEGQTVAPELLRELPLAIRQESACLVTLGDDAHFDPPRGGLDMDPYLAQAGRIQAQADADGTPVRQPCRQLCQPSRQVGQSDDLSPSGARRACRGRGCLR